MDTLGISKKLLATCFTKEQSEVVAQVIEQKDSGVATKDFVKAEIAVLFNKLVIAMIAIAGICLTFVKVFF